MAADLAEEHSTATLATERLEAEQAERMKLEKDRGELEVMTNTIITGVAISLHITKKIINLKADKISAPSMYLRSLELQYILRYLLSNFISFWLFVNLLSRLPIYRGENMLMLSLQCTPG